MKWRDLRARIRVLIEAASHAGVRHDTPPHLAQKIILTNKLCMTYAGISLPYIWVFQWMGVPILGYFIFLIFLVYIALILCNLKYYYFVSRIGTVLTGNLAVFLYASALGRPAGVQGLFFSCSLLPFILFDASSKKSLIFGILISPLLFATLEITHYQLLPEIPLSPSMLELFRYAMIATNFLISFFLIYHLHRAHTKAEKELHNLVLHLKEEILERQATEKERLRLEGERFARIKAEESNRGKDEFLATLSHELRTPLQSMSIWTQLLLRENTSPDLLAKGIKNIEAGLKLQSHLINDLLDVSRILADKLDLDLKPVSLLSALDQAVTHALPAAIERRVHLRLMNSISQSESPGEPLISGDSFRIVQIFSNLLSNAVKFTPSDGKVEVRVSSTPQYLKVEVRDSGIGISAEILPYIFERFWQADSSKTRARGGLGLGLSIVNSLVARHGGTISVASEGAGKGTCFSVEFPRIAVSAPPRVEKKNGTPVLKKISFQGLHILIIDDDEATRRALEEALKNRLIRVSVAASAKEGRQKFEADRPDLIISDIGMPEEDGYSFIRSLRILPDEKGGKTPVIAFSAYAAATDQARAMNAGFDDYLSKPASLSDLFASIGRLAGRSA